MRRLAASSTGLAGGLVLVFSIACGGLTPSASRAKSLPHRAATPAAAPSPAAEATAADLPLTADVVGRASPRIFLGGDDHVGFSVHNQGRPIGQLVIDMGRWFDDHTIAMGSSKLCEIDPSGTRLECGPVPAGATVAFQIRATPDTVGHLSYTARFFDREGGSLQEIRAPDGGELVVRFEEDVAPISSQSAPQPVAPSPI